MRRLVVALLLGACTGVVFSCRSKSGAPTAGDASVVASTPTQRPPLPSSSRPENPNAACAVAYVTWPGPGGPQPGDDLSAVPVPMTIPVGAKLTIAARRSGHEVTLTGPATFRPCTREEPDVVLVARGDVSTDHNAPVRPGSELFIATPACVAVVGFTSLRLEVTAAGTHWSVDAGQAEITTLDVPRTAKGRESGYIKRFEDEGVLLTRCGVQAAGAASVERMLSAIGAASGNPAPLPSASIGVLTAEHIKHAREMTLDCAFAEGFGLSCDALATEPGDSGLGKAGCTAGYAAVRAHVARSMAPQALPPGAPPPPGGP